MLKRLVLYSIILLVVKHYIHYIPNNKLRHTYIATINCPFLGNSTIKKYITEFNNLGPDKDFKFDKDIRPIYIREFKPTEKEQDLLGYTYIGQKEADVYLKYDLEPKQVKPVLLHEMLHGFAFDHVKTPDDLMYPYLSNYVNYEPQYLVYYKKLHKIIYGK